MKWPRTLNLLVEMGLIAAVALALVQDVNAASNKCDTNHDCTRACAAHPILANRWSKAVQTSNRKEGDPKQELACGSVPVYLDNQCTNQSLNLPGLRTCTICCK